MSTSYEAVGKLYHSGETRNATATFRVREFVLEVDSNGYKEYVKFQAVQDRTQDLDKFRTGDELKVTFDLKGRKKDGNDGKEMFFTNLNAWRIEPMGSKPPSFSSSRDEAFDNAIPSLPKGFSDSPSADNNTTFSDDDLPF